VHIQTVLCPVDFSGISDRAVRAAVEVCRAAGADLVLHHNLAAVSPGFARAWDWEQAHSAQEHSRPKAEQRMRGLLAEIPSDVHAQASITSGPVALVVLMLAERLPADLLVLGSHGWTTPDHASVTERIIERCPCPVLTMDEHGDEHGDGLGSGAVQAGRRLNVLVPTDFSPSADRAVAYACALARLLPLRLHLFHVATAGHRDHAVLDAAHALLRAMVPPELAGQTDVHVDVGRPLERILEFAAETAPAFMVMGEHTRGFFRRLLTRDTALGVLHRASCQVWYVPAAAKVQLA
jgi:nucleotide-binding universal stress UspA family protein